VQVCVQRKVMRAQMSHAFALCAYVRQQILRSLNKSTSGNSTRSHLFNGAKQRGTNSLALHHLISTRLFSRQNIARARCHIKGFHPPSHSHSACDRIVTAYSERSHGSSSARSQSESNICFYLNGNYYFTLITLVPARRD
jgi:hypothetical protein